MAPDQAISQIVRPGMRVVNVGRVPIHEYVAARGHNHLNVCGTVPSEDGCIRGNSSYRTRGNTGYPSLPRIGTIATVDLRGT